MADSRSIPDIELEKIAGGMVVYSQGLPEYDAAYPWEVVENSTGRVLGKFQTQDQACCFARSFGPDEYNDRLMDAQTILGIRASSQGTW